MLESKLVFEINDRVAQFSDAVPSRTEVIGLLRLCSWSSPLTDAMEEKPKILQSCREVTARHFKQHMQDSFKKMDEIFNKAGMDQHMMLRLCETSVSHADKVAKLSPIVLTAISEIQEQTVKDFSDCLSFFEAFMGPEAMNFEDTLCMFGYFDDCIAPSFPFGAAILAKILPAFPVVATILCNHKPWFTPFSLEGLCSPGDGNPALPIKDCVKEPVMSIVGLIEAVKEGQAMLKGLQQQATKQKVTLASLPKVKDGIGSWLTLPFVSQLLTELAKFIDLCVDELIARVWPLSNDAKSEVEQVTCTVEQDIQKHCIDNWDLASLKHLSTDDKCVRLSTMTNAPSPK